MNVSLILILAALSTTMPLTRSTLLASTGYLASNPTIRNLLIRYGISEIIRRQSSTLYDISGFRYASDQGTGVGQAGTNTHDVIEVAAKKLLRRKMSLAPEVQAGSTVLLGSQWKMTENESGSKEYVRSRAETNLKDRDYSEKLFGVLSQMDRNTCISKLLCEIGADPKSYGKVGLKVNHYIRSVPPVTWNSATYSYIESFHSGQISGKESCAQNYESCNYDLNRVIEFLWIFIHPMKLQ